MLLVIFGILIGLTLWLCYKSENKEGFDSFNEDNKSYWPQFYYSAPYNYKFGGAWPPGMYSKLYYWSPGFYN